MQIVINLSDEVMERLTNGSEDMDDAAEIIESIAQGIILPKGHGRLFDEREIVNGNYEVIGNRIYELEPVIEADKGE